MKKFRFRSISAVLATLLIVGSTLINIPFTVSADNAQFMVTGKTYSFGEDEAYPFSTSSQTSSVTTGNLMISGKNASQTSKDGITAFSVEKSYTADSDYNLSFTYNLNSAYLNTGENNWHLIKDGSKKIDTITLGEKIETGAVIVQTSKDGKLWFTTEVCTDAFMNVSTYTYRTTDVQLVNGCYYRVIVAYELCKKVDSSKFLVWDIDKFEKKKQVEVYELFASEKTAQKSNFHGERYELGKTSRTAKFDGYFGTQEMIQGKDPHYGWKLGQFYLGGYTEVKNDGDNIVVLKNVGDQVVLWFDLFYNLDRLNNNPALSIKADPSGHDQAFQTPTQDFGKGALIIQKTDYNNHVNEPVVYKNYLEAVATVGAKTKVDLFEEGDYEVALDYAVSNDKMMVLGKSIFPGESHYRINFKFSVRNANSMFYPRDVATQSELSNGDITPNGFFLDLANSKYLRLSIIREVLKDGATGLTEDTRLNTVAKNGDRYTKDGVYTITVTNQYTGKSTSKKIYVGDNNILKAYMVTGLSISEIQDRIAAGATIASDGSIIDPPTIPETEFTEVAEATEAIEAAVATAETSKTASDEPTLPSVKSTVVTETPATETIADQQEDVPSKEEKLPIFFACVAVILGVLLVVLSNNRKQKETKE